MSVYEVPRQEWSRFCRRLVEQGRGTPVTLELTSETDCSISGPHELTGLYIEEVELNGTPRGDERVELQIVLGRGDGQEAFALPELRRLVLEQAAETAPTQLRAESSLHMVASISFKRPLIPGELDGLP